MAKIDCKKLSAFFLSEIESNTTATIQSTVSKFIQAPELVKIKDQVSLTYDMGRFLTEIVRFYLNCNRFSKNRRIESPIIMPFNPNKLQQKLLEEFVEGKEAFEEWMVGTKEDPQQFNHFDAIRWSFVKKWNVKNIPLLEKFSTADEEVETLQHSL